jgi:hypothetical protein
MCQLEHNFLCRLCPFEDKCEQERANLTEEQQAKIKEMEEMGE